MGLGLVEFVLFSTAFISMGFNYLSSIAQGAAFAFTQTYGLHLAIHVLRDKFKQPPSKRFLWTVVLVSIALTLSVGIFRFQSVPESAGGRPLFMLAVFCMVTIVMMAYTAFSTLHYYPSKAERIAQKEIDAKRAALAAQQAHIAGMRSEINRLTNEKNRIAKLNSQIMDAEHTLLQRIKACFKEAIGIFISVNLTKRSDGNIPDGFHEEVRLPDLVRFSISRIDPPQN